MYRRYLYCTLSVVLLLAACSGPKMLIYDRPVSATKTSRALTNSTALSHQTRETLRQEHLLSLYKNDAEKTIRDLVKFYQQQPTATRRSALAELLSDQGDRLTAKQPTLAIGYYLDAAQLTEKDALISIKRKGESSDHTLYNHCAARVSGIINQLKVNSTVSVTAPGILHPWRLSVAKSKAAVDPCHYDILVPASWLKTKGIHWENITQDGFGAAMVGYTKATPERKAKDSMMPSNGRAFPLNASFRLSGNSATLVLQNLLTNSTATVGRCNTPLAGNFSAALAFFYYDQQYSLSKMGALLRPQSHKDTTKMYSIEPFRKDKTPLVLVHGLMSTAEGWLPFVNQLLADSVVREKYQILFFNYPTGNMVAKNAADLRDALVTFQKSYDPDRRNPRMRNMVILGHSMGGIISNMQIRDSGDRLYKSVFTENLSELELGDIEKKEIRRLAFFNANPDINRVLLLAAPLRGSEMAMGKIGQLGARLIRMPFNLIDSALGNIKVVDAMTDVGQEWSMRSNNSVSGLRPDNPTLHDVLDSPVRHGVTIHSIIAQNNPKDTLLESSDGVVPYTSAHLDEAASEKIIMGANHRSMVEKHETLEEVWRILRLHIGADQAR